MDLADLILKKKKAGIGERGRGPAGGRRLLSSLITCEKKGGRESHEKRKRGKELNENL